MELQELKPKKWSPTLINYTRNICIRAWKLKLQESPIESPVDVKEAVELHEYACEFIRTGHDNYLRFFNDAVQKELIKIKHLQGSKFLEHYLSDYLIQGVVDCAIMTDQGWIVIDFKTRYNSEIKHEDKVQLLCYLYLLQKTYPASGNFHKIAILAFHNNYQPLQYEIANYDIDYLTDYVKRQITLAENRLKHLKINFGWCKNCEYIFSCDVEERLADSIDDIAQKYIKLSETLKRYEDILKNYTNRTGANIKVGDYEIGMHERTKTVIDIETLKHICKKHNFDHEKLLKPDVRLIQKAAKNFPELLNAVFKEFDKYVFYAKKSKEESSQ